MFQFISRRLFVLLVTFIGITLITFTFIHLLPGDPAMIMLGERGTSPEHYAKMMERLGLDRSLWRQYLSYIYGLLRGDLGVSLVNNLPVLEEFWPRFKATLELGFCAITLAIIVGIPCGVLAAVKRGSVLDYMIIGFSLIGYSMPIFWWGIMMIMLISVHWDLTPVAGRVCDSFFLDDSYPLTGFMLIDTLFWGDSGNFIDAVRHLILPTIVLSTVPLAVIVRMTRSSMLEVLNESYILTARAKGLSKARVIWVHALRNALLPVVTMISLQVGALIAGAILTETIFSWPGLGRWIVESLNKRDYPVVQGGILVISTLVILINIMLEILYGIIDPRIRFKNKESKNV